MTFGTRATTPMTRADWAWVLTCFIGGTLIALLGFAAEVGDKNAHPYARRVSFETNGDVQKIIYAVESAAPDSHLEPYSTHPPYDFFTDWFANVFGVLVISCLFRILEKICGRLLGLPTRVGIAIGREPESESKE